MMASKDIRMKTILVVEDGPIVTHLPDGGVITVRVRLVLPCALPAGASPRVPRGAHAPSPTAPPGVQRRGAHSDAA